MKQSGSGLNTWLHEGLNELHVWPKGSRCTSVSLMRLLKTCSRMQQGALSL